VRHGRHVAEVIEGHDLDVVAAGPDGPPEVATDPTEAVDTYANRHDASPLEQNPRTPPGCAFVMACAPAWCSTATLPTCAL
jgi:hypothetical protein